MADVLRGGSGGFCGQERGAADGASLRRTRMLEKAGLTLQDFDFYEIHEAFASQVLCTLEAWQDPAFCKDRLGRTSRWAASTGTNSM